MSTTWSDRPTNDAVLRVPLRRSAAWIRRRSPFGLSWHPVGRTNDVSRRTAGCSEQRFLRTAGPSTAGYAIQLARFQPCRCGQIPLRGNRGRISPRFARYEGPETGESGAKFPAGGKLARREGPEVASVPGGGNLAQKGPGRPRPGYRQCQPQSTIRSTPLTAVFSSRNTAASTISSIWASRPSGDSDS